MLSFFPGWVHVGKEVSSSLREITNFCNCLRHTFSNSTKQIFPVRWGEGFQEEGILSYAQN